MDVSTAITAIEAGAATIGSIGLAVLILVVGIKLWKRLRSAV